MGNDHSSRLTFWMLIGAITMGNMARHGVEECAAEAGMSLDGNSLRLPRDTDALYCATCGCLTACPAPEWGQEGCFFFTRILD
jgi:hypothetical protein